MSPITISLITSCLNILLQCLRNYRISIDIFLVVVSCGWIIGIVCVIERPFVCSARIAYITVVKRIGNPMWYKFPCVVAYRVVAHTLTSNSLCIVGLIYQLATWLIVWLFCPRVVVVGIIGLGKLSYRKGVAVAIAEGNLHHRYTLLTTHIRRNTQCERISNATCLRYCRAEIPTLQYLHHPQERRIASGSSRYGCGVICQQRTAKYRFRLIWRPLILVLAPSKSKGKHQHSYYATIDALKKIINSIKTSLHLLQP